MIKIENITYKINQATILNNINLTIPNGGITALIGANGAGKSTLLSLVARLNPIQQGQIWLNDMDIGTTPSRTIAQNLAILTQDNVIHSRITVKDLLVFGRYPHHQGHPTEEDNAIIRDALQRFELAPLANRFLSELSGGQQQRVSIARALMNGGEIIFADEPTGALDTASGKNVMEIIHKLHEDGHTVIMVTHDPGIAANANRVIEIRDGQIISDTSKNPDIPPSKVERIKEKASWSFYYDQFMEAFKMSVQAIMAHKMRSLLTMLGIIIGITSVVSVVALGNGSQQKILEDINSMGTNTISIFPGRGFGDRRSGRIKTLTINDAKAISQQSYVASATPQTNSSGTLTYRNTDLTASLYGVGEQYFDVRGLKLEEGRLFDDDDVKNDAQVVVIDQNTKTKLFGEGVNPLGKTILFKKRPLTVIGIMKKDDNSFGNSDSLMLWSPYTTVMHQITGESYTNSIVVKIKDDANTQVAEKSLTELLKARHGTEDFFMNNSDSIKEMVESTTGTMTLLISSIAVISLVVGGIGVMNIMLVSVTERTKEIGVRMAIGARRNNILQQFLIEAVLICIIGGLSGVLLSASISLVFNYFVTDFPMSISMTSVIGAVVCSTAIGVAFGFMPANKASKLNPIDALAQD